MLSSGQSQLGSDLYSCLVRLYIEHVSSIFDLMGFPLRANQTILCISHICMDTNIPFNKGIGDAGTG